MQVSKKIIGVIPVLSLVGGCAGLTGGVEESFGDSVRTVVAAQALHQGGPLALDEPQPHTDGRRMENVLDSRYRIYIGDPQQVVKDIPVDTRAKDAE